MIKFSYQIQIFYISIIFIIFQNISLVNCIIDPVEYVNLRAGTFTDGRRFSTGNTLPLTGMPWGFNHWAPQTQRQDQRGTAWWFDGNSHEFHWIRCTHQPSPWIGDWGWFLLGPQIGGMNMNPQYFWEPRAAVMKPHYFEANIADVSYIYQIFL